jgi:hypothetical protein
LDKNSLLILAIQAKLIVTARQLLAEGADPNARSKVN